MSRDVIATLDPMIAEHSMLKHPFYQAWTAGTLSMERLQNYAVEYYPHVAAFPRYLSAIHSRCADIGTRHAILENLIEEERGPENHPELWLRFAEALGVARERVLESKPSASSRAISFAPSWTSPKAGTSRAGLPRSTVTSRRFQRWQRQRSTASSAFTESTRNVAWNFSACIKRRTCGTRRPAPT